MLLERILAQEEEKGSRCSRQIIVLGIVVGLVSAAGGGGLNLISMPRIGLRVDQRPAPA